jgi:rhodanese-related sulfurtransferase
VTAARKPDGVHSLDQRTAGRTCTVGADYTTEDLRENLSAVTVVEALGPAYYGTAHIPGAVNIPPHRVAELAPALLPDKACTIVVYGAEGHSSDTEAVVRRLTALGYRRVSRYAGGKVGWAEAGLPLVGDPGS